MRCDAMRRVCMSGNGHGAIRFTKEEETKWLVIRLHCVSRKELQHWRRNSWKRPAYMPSCHALVGAQETDSTHAHHSSDQLTRTASLYFGRLDELTTSISHGPRATSHEPRVLWRAPLGTGVGALNNSLSKANCMASWNPAMSDAFCTSTA